MFRLFTTATNRHQVTSRIKRGQAYPDKEWPDAYLLMADVNSQNMSWYWMKDQKLCLSV